jgi:hypothetical protein
MFDIVNGLYVYNVVLYYAIIMSSWAFKPNMIEIKLSIYDDVFIVQIPNKVIVLFYNETRDY